MSPGTPRSWLRSRGPMNSTSTPSMAAMSSAAATAAADSICTTQSVSWSARSNAPGSSPNRQARLQVAQHGGHLCGAVEPGQHDAGSSAVQRPSDPDPFRGLDANDGGDPVAAGCGDHVADLLLAAGAVFEVEQH